MDRIIIRDLQLSTVVGIFEEERKNPQTVILNLVVFTDLARVGASDDFRDALDYSALETAVKKTVENARCFLVERLAQLVADRCLAFPAVQSVEVTLDKPGAARYARSIAVAMERSRA